MGAATHERVEPDEDLDGPERTCVVNRERRPVEDLIRFVQGPDGTIVPDLAGRLPGRGVWVAATRADVEKAIKIKAFHRSLKRETIVPEDLADRVETLILRRVMQALSLANKAGLVLTGFTKVEQAISGGKVVILLHAVEAAPDGVEKLDRRLRSMMRDTGGTATVLTVLTIDQISLALGRSNVVHAALEKGGATANFLAGAMRLVRYRSGANAAPEISMHAGPNLKAGNTDQV